MFKQFFVMALFGTISVFAGKISTINQETFNSKIKSEKKVLIDFYAEWCGPCKLLGPVLEMVDDDMGDQVAIYKVNVEQSPELAKRYEVTGLPTMILFENGSVKGKLVGAHDKTAVKRFIESK